MSKPLIKQLLMSSNYWTLNKEVVRIFGIETAFLLTNLAEAEHMMADEAGWFYQTSDTLEEITGITRYKQDRAIEVLERHGVIKKEIRGVPAKRYFKLNYSILEHHIEQHIHKKAKEKKAAQDPSIQLPLEPQEEIKPKAEEEKPANIHEQVIIYLNEQTGNKYRPQTEATKRTIRARQREGYTLDDFKTVIDKKVKEWKGSEFEKYLRPATLFGSKFESYLNQKEGKAKTSGFKGYQPRSLPETYAEDPDDFAKWFKE